ncbi:MAG TPA: adenine deaminase [Victivallales bacterium]|nr:adenine deaminase [Victivallales bacterium]
MRTFDEINTTVQAGLGKIKCDLKLTNVKLVNVYSSEIYPSDIYIKGKRIVSISPIAGLEANETIDCKGQYAIPGLIDSHMHFETTLLAPETLVDIILPNGTTTLCMDAMEIANVAGEAGLKEMLQSIDQLPYRAYLEVSSRVPTAPKFETTGGVLGIVEVEKLLDCNESLSLGEIDPSKIFYFGGEYIEKIVAALQRRKKVNGHAIGRYGQELNVYASAGVSDDHECVDVDELIDRVRLGMTVMVREGSSERNVDSLINGVIENSLTTEFLLFCTDDKHVNDIMSEGHINYNVNRAIELGLAPMKAIQIASINAARHFRVEDEIGSITPGRLADILLTKDINKINPSRVFFEGKLVAENGKIINSAIPREYPEWIKNTVKFKKAITPKSFIVISKKNEPKTKVNAIELIDDQIINNWICAELPVENGEIGCDLNKDLLKLSVVERYGKTCGIGNGFVKGFKLKKGALASSVSHDHHNIICVGTNDEDMSVAVNALKEIQGGFVVVENKKVIGKIQLSLGGLMSQKPTIEVLKEAENINKIAKILGTEMASPFMTLSFISLPTVPKLGLTDKGLVDVQSHRLINLEI